ncbi:MAG: hypothetical protein IMZ66_08635 [Planctomycetes bacterium]|nr:hypothetical protein [Planctomycetota bacterium]
MVCIAEKRLWRGKPLAEGLTGRDLRRAIRLLPLRQRSILRILYLRGASQGELAGALGISRQALRRMLRQALRRATDPTNLALVACWRRLTPYERRLAYLNRFLGLALPKIARLSLVAMPADRGRTPWGRRRYLEHTMRTIVRKALRHARRAAGQDSAGAAPAGSSPGPGASEADASVASAG